MKLKNNIADIVKEDIKNGNDEILNALVEHFAYSVADIDSYDELTEFEKNTIPKNTFDKIIK